MNLYGDYATEASAGLQLPGSLSSCFVLQKQAVARKRLMALAALPVVLGTYPGPRRANLGLHWIRPWGKLRYAHSMPLVWRALVGKTPQLVA